ncbi:helix-turn-helix domain-containing protein [Thalassospira sp. MA62]|nr:helix-turn-helix domain-containing protein [Thalassospira sp. MA62]
MSDLAAKFGLVLDEMYSPKQLAEKLSFSTQMVNKLIKNREFAHYPLLGGKEVRILGADVANYLEGVRVECAVNDNRERIDFRSRPAMESGRSYGGSGEARGGIPQDRVPARAIGKRRRYSSSVLSQKKTAKQE